jgi:hypothetical protein
MMIKSISSSLSLQEEDFGVVIGFADGDVAADLAPRMSWNSCSRSLGWYGERSDGALVEVRSAGRTIGFCGIRALNTSFLIVSPLHGRPV